jgi:hypothetical protein
MRCGETATVRTTARETRKPYFRRESAGRGGNANDDGPVSMSSAVRHTSMITASHTSSGGRAPIALCAIDPS